MPLCSSITSISYNDEQKLIAGKFSQPNERNEIASLALHRSFAHSGPTSLPPLMQEKLFLILLMKEIPQQFCTVHLCCRFSK